MTLDPKAMDAASYAMQEVSCCSSENICEVCRKDASVVVTSYLTHALPALLAAAERRGIERAAEVVQEAVGDRDSDLRSIIRGIRALSVDGEPTP